ncbi:MAG: ATP-binding protein [bacterium]|nr:ATP-binding protein [bacterium]
MTFTGRIRLFLILVAILPPLAVTAVIYFRTMHQTESDELSQLRSNLEVATAEMDRLKQNSRDAINAIADSESMIRALADIRQNRRVAAPVDPKIVGMDFLEICDSEGTVLYSYNRPGLIGQRVAVLPGQTKQELKFLTEYDFEGGHPTLAGTAPLNKKYLVYSGLFLDAAKELRFIESILRSKLQLITDHERLNQLSSMRPFELYQNNSRFEALLILSDDKEFAFAVQWDQDQSQQTLASLLLTTLVVAFSSALIAIILGLWLTGRAKREVDNLVTATAKVAEGDFGEPVMAYEEGEFSQLADAFTAMTMKLKGARRELVAAEKIAAWQSVGRTIAHELKNPLSPIAISAEDLRRSYQEKLPDFENILLETTGTIRSEVSRLTRLLDEFVGFARMKPPEIVEVAPDMLSQRISSLYSTEISASRLTVINLSQRSQVSIDPEAINQLLVNLIKNGLEADESGRVTLLFEDAEEKFIIKVEDSGPGFSTDQLENLFTPYKTTKSTGTGLGLVVCYRIARDHNGSLELYNLDSGGAGVRVSLPAE